VIFMLAQGPGQKLQETVGGEIGSLFLLVVTFLSLCMFWQRQFTKFIGFVLFAMVVSILIFTPEWVKTLGTDAFYWLFEDMIS
jgi:hypothetical protein